MLAKLKHNVDDDIQALLPDAIEIAKAKKERDLIMAPPTLQFPLAEFRVPKTNHTKIMEL